MKRWSVLVCILSALTCTAYVQHRLFYTNKVQLSSLSSPVLRASKLQSSNKSNFEDEDVTCVSEGGQWAKPFAPSPDFTASIESDARINGTGDDKMVIFKNMQGTLGLMGEWGFKPSTAENILLLSDAIDNSKKNQGDDDYERINTYLLRLRRQNMLADVLRRNRSEYIEIASFLCQRIPRSDLPNVQNIPLATQPASSFSDEYIDDCILPNQAFKESVLDKWLLKVFRSFVQEEIRYVSPKEGILGLLDEGRYYKLSEEGQVNDSANQHKMVRTVLGRLLTPFLPPFYRIFMAGMIPSKEMNDPEWLVKGTNKVLDFIPETWSIKKELYSGKQLGPWFYAPALTSSVTPFFMNFLLGPARVNYRKDGQLGGMVVEKCKFLQESNCKGLCLHQCKLPAQQFFADNLGVPLTVSPNFVTQECQWSWGEMPLDHKDDPDFPKGCIRGCETKTSMSKE